MKNVQYSLHIMIEERTRAAAKDAADRVRDICTQNGATEIENSIPKILRANPFTPLNNMVGPNGERWVPVHGVVPHSKARLATDRIREVFARNDAEMDQHGIGTGFLFATVSNNLFIIEPVFFTPDSLNEIHAAYVEDKIFNGLPGFESNPEASRTTAKVRQEVIDELCTLGATHFQIGKAYPYRQGLHKNSWSVVEALKNSVDPDRRINPGSLGLD